METNTITLILTALTTGAAAGLKETTSQAVKDGYGKLKSLLHKKLQDRHHTELCVTLNYRKASKPGPAWF